MPGIRERLQAALEGEYIIERELGEGGMATVLLAAMSGTGAAARSRYSSQSWPPP